MASLNPDSVSPVFMSASLIKPGHKRHRLMSSIVNGPVVATVAHRSSNFFSAS